MPERPQYSPQELKARAEETGWIFVTRSPDGQQRLECEGCNLEASIAFARQLAEAHLPDGKGWAVEFDEYGGCWHYRRRRLPLQDEHVLYGWLEPPGSTSAAEWETHTMRRRDAWNRSHRTMPDLPTPWPLWARLALLALLALAAFVVLRLAGVV